MPSPKRAKTFCPVTSMPRRQCRRRRSSSSNFDVPLGDGAGVAEQLRLVAPSVTEHHHRWWYYPDMSKEEVLLLKQYDSDPTAPARFCFHSSFTDPGASDSAPCRESVEVSAFSPRQSKSSRLWWAVPVTGRRTQPARTAGSD